MLNILWIPLYDERTRQTLSGDPTIVPVYDTMSCDAGDAVTVLDVRRLLLLGMIQPLARIQGIQLCCVVLYFVSVFGVFSTGFGLFCCAV